MARFHCLTFLTDYGLGDAFVGVCHGVASRIAPDLRIVDITHLIPLADIHRGATVLAQATPYFPPAVHVAVVDPGVGTTRRGVAVQAGQSLFVGPDNGLLSVAIAQAGGADRAVSLTNAALWLDTPAVTFHGRDIFMPVAARLASGMPLDQAGQPVEVSTLVTLPSPEYRIADGAVQAEVVTVDGFGNVQLSMPGADAPGAGLLPGTSVALAWDGREVVLPFVRAFGEVPPGEPLCYRDGGDWVAIAVSSGDAARLFGLRTGIKVTLTPGGQITHHTPNVTK